ncbi:TonB family protein [Chelativorans salis]|uniref:Protein TonB n=1 Tax=Chelativorans salis TaxID=2978478 RepID=A0ABT2LPH1_9HYPH|nr:energy transducer TonB [Chelativorans sp. EGI FJ00035]MCT7375288.1 energy transducer TonB [Chelativorans sp. EGI FJ00035]
MRANAWKWGLALGLSGIIHAGKAVLMLPREPEVEIAGGSSIEIAVAGNAFTDLSAAGTPVETVEPVTEAPTEATPVEPTETTTAEAPVVTAVSPSETEAPAEAEATPETETPEAEPSELQAAEIEPVEPEETVTAMVNIPRPTPRPDYEPPKETRAPAPQKAAVRPPAQKKTQTSAGSGGRDTQNARRGSTQSGQSAKANRGQAAPRATASGNAALSNYPGKIVSRLRRALRYPSAAKRERLRGEVQVAFTIAGSGAVSGVRVVRSSGSPVLDQAAIETVQRAAPFPAIPDGAGRSSWPFTVPLAFTR